MSIPWYYDSFQYFLYSYGWNECFAGRQWLTFHNVLGMTLLHIALSR